MGIAPSADSGRGVTLLVSRSAKPARLIAAVRNRAAHFSQQHLHVLPDFLLFGRLPVRQQERRVIRAHHRNSLVGVKLAAEAAERGGRVQ